MRTNTSMK